MIWYMKMYLVLIFLRTTFKFFYFFLGKTVQPGDTMWDEVEDLCSESWLLKQKVLDDFAARFNNARRGKFDDAKDKTPEDDEE